MKDKRRIGNESRYKDFIPFPSFKIRRRDGFTLLEVLIALAIVSGLLITVISTLNYHLSLVEKHEAITTATLLAKYKLISMERNPVEEKGVFGEPYGNYSYETYIKDSPYPHIKEIAILVKCGNEEVRLNEFVYK